MTARDHLRRLSDEIVEAQKPIRILKAINWSAQVHERFLRAGGRELPKPTYRALDFDAQAKKREFRNIRSRLKGKNALEALLRARCDEFILAVEMLEARGTRRFHDLSVKLYGEPSSAFADSGEDNLAIARMWAGQSSSGDAPERTLNATEARDAIIRIIEPVLGDACRVRVSSTLTADAAAGATGLAVRKGARFSRQQVRALAHHEGLWHVLTSLNGYGQPVLTVLGVGLAGYATAQEGGGVVSEYLSGNLSAERMRELGERALVVDMVARGADYIEVFDYLCERFPQTKASQLAERVFRGGLVTGGAPFTKDAIYQRGYCRVFNFLRHAVAQNRLPLIHAFIAGKMRLEDAPLVAELIESGVVHPPRFLPPWARRLGSLRAEVMHSLTMTRFDVERVGEYYDEVGAQHLQGLAGWEQEFARRAELPKRRARGGRAGR